MTKELQQRIVFEIQDEKNARKMCEILEMNGYKAKVDNFTSPYLVYIDVIVVEETDTIEKINSWVTEMVSFYKKGGRLNHENKIDITSPSETPYVYSDGIEIKHNYGETKTKESSE